jgi:pyruvate,orthophosphate dikinase
MNPQTEDRSPPEQRFVYDFGDGVADGNAGMRDLLGSKGANLHEMTRLGLPVPPGFTITTEACRAFWSSGELSAEVRAQVLASFALLEKRTGLRLGDPAAPLLVSVRSGAAATMPGMMDTVLNIGLNDWTVLGLAERTANERFAWDSYRRLLHMYSNVVLGLHSDHLEQLLERMKEKEDVHSDASLSSLALRELCQIFQEKIVDLSGRRFPQDPTEQLWAAIGAVFRSWNNHRAVHFRNANHIPHDLGTAVTVQAMVFGNMGPSSATGVAFTRDPNTGASFFFGEWLPNAQGEDVVSGLTTPYPLNSQSGALDPTETMQHALPMAYADLVRIKDTLERHYRDVQDIEFTVEQDRLWILQTRTAKRSATAEVRIAVDLVQEGVIDPREAILRVRTETLERLMHPCIDPDAPREVLTRGLGASPGAASGRIAFSTQDAIERAGRGEDVILVRRETSPEDVHGMLRSKGVLTARGGMTSHAAVVARGMSKPCIVGCRDLEVDIDAKTMRLGAHTFREGDILTIDGADGTVMRGRVPTVQPKQSPEVTRLMSWVDGYRRLSVRTNADTARECRVARDFGAEGVGLCRTEHMFFEEDRVMAVREMILAEDETGRRKALAQILPMQRSDFIAIFRTMAGLPVTIRLLDPPLHEFLTENPGDLEAMAARLEMPLPKIRERYRALREVNPMLGHRGCRLGLSFPEIYEMQVSAIIEAACILAKEGLVIEPEILIPLVFHVRELEILRELIRSTAEAIQLDYGTCINYRIGSMIELPRACVTADQLATAADFFSFGTNDLTQTTFGISRDDCGRFMPLYIDIGLLPGDPFVAMDPAVGELVKLAVDKGRKVKPDLKIGICGEQGGEASTIRFCHGIGLDYVSCSPFRVPIARLAAAQAALATQEPA